MRGKFIAIEGIDGTGKSTLARRLRNMIELELGSRDVMVTHEPCSVIENTIRNLFKRSEGPLHPEAMSVLFTADRLLHMDQVVLPALEQGAWVISDRHKLSTLVYQTAMGADSEALRVLCQVPSPSPDLTLVLDADPKLTRKRMQKRSLKLDAYEKDIDRQSKMRDLYVRWASEFGPSCVLNAEVSEDALLSEAVHVVLGHFGIGK